MERVGDDVAFGLENPAWPLEAMRARVPEALAGVGLAGFEGRRSTRLSGGEQQRVAIAGVLAPGTGVLVLDEPTANLDPDGRPAVFRDPCRPARPRHDDDRAGGASRLAGVRSRRRRAGARRRRPADRPRARPPTSWRDRPRGSRRPGSGCPSPRTPARAARSRSAVVARAGSRARATAAHDHPRRRCRSSSCRTCASATSRASRSFATSISGWSRGSGSRSWARTAAARPRCCGSRWASCGRSRARSASAGALPARCGAVQLARLAGYVVQDPELGFLGDSVREEVEPGLRARAGRPRPRAVRAAGSAARGVRRSEPVPALRRRTAPALARDRPRPAAAPPRPRRADVRPGSPRPRGARRGPRRAGRGGERPRSRRPTTSASSATPRGGGSSWPRAGSSTTRSSTGRPTYATPVDGAGLGRRRVEPAGS